MATEYIIRMLGLEVCADTPVGSAMIRGISGGQRKRVTSGEMLVSAKRVRAESLARWSIAWCSSSCHKPDGPGDVSTDTCANPVCMTQPGTCLR